jgi:VWFA-related protein
MGAKMRANIRIEEYFFVRRVVQMIWLYVFLFALFFGLLPPYAETDQEDLQQEVTVTVKLVQIYVVDKEGNPITDLSQSDFELYDNGKPVKITEFEKHILSLPSEKSGGDVQMEKKAEGAEPAPRLTRKFLLFFDFAFNDGQGILKAKKAALHFMDSQVHPEDEIGIMSYDIYRGLTLHEYFSVEHDKVREVIENFDIKEARGRAENFAKDDWSEFRFEDQGGGSRASLNDADGILDAASEQIYKIQVRNFAKKMGDLAKALRYIPGTKQIVLFSGGVANIILYGEHMPKATGGISSVSPAPLNTGDVVLRDIYEVMCREMAASNSLVYPVNTTGKGLSHFRSRDSMGDFSLRTMARLSGGNYFDNISSYEDVIERIQSITSTFYVLGYYIDEKWDGKYHKLKVKVKRKGCQVLGQKGYFNPEPFSKYSKMEKMLHLVDLALSENPLLQEPLRFPLIALPFAQDQKADCVAVARISADKIEDILGEKMEVVTLFFDKDKNIADMQRSEARSLRLSQDDVYFYSFYSLAPGGYDCRVVIRNMKTGQGAVAASSIAIPQTPDSGLLLYPPLLLAEKGNASYIDGTEKKKSVEETSLEDIYSFDSSRYVPVVRDLDEDTANKQAVVRCSIFGLDDPELKIHAYLTRPSTSEKIPLEFTILNQSKDQDIWQWLIEFPIADLMPGKYSLNLTAEEVNTERRSEARADFIIR